MIGPTQLQDEVARNRYQELVDGAEADRLVNEAVAGRPQRSLWLAAQRAFGLALIRAGQRLTGAQRAAQASQQGILDRSLGFAR
jgi:hypothetical protein